MVSSLTVFQYNPVFVKRQWLAYYLSLVYKIMLLVSYQMFILICMRTIACCILLEINVYDHLQSSLANFDMWCMQNNMVLNVSKSKCLIIGSMHKLGNIDYDCKLNIRNISL